MAQGNIEIKFSYSDTANTELGEMARSLRVFKENEKKRRGAEEEIRRLAMTDPLTGLSNRNQFNKKCIEIISLAKRENRLIALLALDLDKFKPVNDEYGHAIGDAVLKNTAKHLLMAVRETDLVARMGGDEFLIILYSPESVETITSIAQRIINLLSTPISIDHKLITVGASIGIALHESGSTEPTEMLAQRADNALYKAKASGRNTYRIYP